MNLQNQTNPNSPSLLTQIEHDLANLTRCNDCRLYFPAGQITYFAADDMSLCGKCEALELQTMPFLSDRELLGRYDELVDAFDDDPRHGESPAAYQERIALQLLELDEVHRLMWPRFPGYAASVAPEDVASRLVEWWNSDLGKWELAEVVESSNFYAHLDGRLHSHQPVTLRRWNHEIVGCHLGAIRMPHLAKRPTMPCLRPNAPLIVLERQCVCGTLHTRATAEGYLPESMMSTFEDFFNADQRHFLSTTTQCIIEIDPEYPHVPF